MQRLGARPIDADGPEAAEFFWRQHRKWSERLNSPRVAKWIADGTSQEDRVAATRAQIALAADWARAGRVDLGAILLDLLGMGGDTRAIAHAALEIALIRGECQKSRTA